MLLQIVLGTIQTEGCFWHMHLTTSCPKTVRWGELGEEIFTKPVTLKHLPLSKLLQSLLEFPLNLWDVVYLVVTEERSE